jgi:hypothetical protein
MEGFRPVAPKARTPGPADRKIGGVGRVRPGARNRPDDTQAIPRPKGIPYDGPDTLRRVRGGRTRSPRTRPAPSPPMHAMCAARRAFWTVSEGDSLLKK